MYMVDAMDDCASFIAHMTKINLVASLMRLPSVGTTSELQPMFENLFLLLMMEM